MKFADGSPDVPKETIFALAYGARTAGSCADWTMLSGTPRTESNVHMLTLNVTKLMEGAPKTKLSTRSLYLHARGGFAGSCRTGRYTHAHTLSAYLPGPHAESDSGKFQATPYDTLPEML